MCGFVNIPIVAFLFTPFSMLTLRHAHWLFAGLSLLSLVISVGLLWSMTDRVASRRWGIVALFMTSGPLLYSLKEGNLTHFALLLLIAGVVCLDKTWDRSAGVVLHWRRSSSCRCCCLRCISSASGVGRRCSAMA